MRSVHDLMSLKGRLALVTGGKGWLGSAISETLLELGADVVSVGRSVSPQFDIVDTGRLVEYTLDLDKCGESLEHGVEALMNFLATKYGTSPHVLVNNMCVWPKNVDFMSTTSTQMHDAFTANVIPQLYLTQRIAAVMPARGSIVNMTSMYAKVSPDQKMYRGVGGNALEYGAAKAAMLQATKYLAALLGPRNIRVNSISPGPFSRPGSLDEKEWFRDELNQRTMLGRVADREELKGAIALLASDLGSYITGEDIAVDGGWTKL